MRDATISPSNAIAPLVPPRAGLIFDLPAPEVPEGFDWRVIHGTAPEEIHRLRQRAWEKRGHHVELSKWHEPVDDDPGTAHILVNYGRQYVAAVRLTIHAGLVSLPQSELYIRHIDQIGLDALLPTTSIATGSRAVVDPHFQGQGLYRWLQQRRLQLSFLRGAALSLCDVPDYTAAMMKRIGYTQLGESELQPGMPQDVRWAVFYLRFESQPGASIDE